MSIKNALFFSVSDLVLYEKLKSLSQDCFPDQTFAFLGSTYADDMPWRPGQKADFLPTSRLLYRWVLMNERTERTYIPAITSGAYDAVFVHELGREAYHYALRHCDCEQALHFHKALVELRLIQQGGSPPTAYLASRPTNPRLIEADERYFADPNQRIHYLDAPTVDEQLHEVLPFLANELGAGMHARAAVA